MAPLILAPEFSWKALQNPYGSGHFPITLERKVSLPGLLMWMPRWKLNKEGCTLFEMKAFLDPNTLTNLSPEESNRSVTKAIISTATISIPLTSVSYLNVAGHGGTTNDRIFVA